MENAYFSYCLFLQSLLRGSVVGIIFDDSVRLVSRSTSSDALVQNKHGFSFTKMGYAVDSAIVNL